MSFEQGCLISTLSPVQGMENLHRVMSKASQGNVEIILPSVIRWLQHEVMMKDRERERERERECL